MNQAAVITHKTSFSGQSCDVTARDYSPHSLNQIIERALNDGYVTRSQQKNLLMALFLNQPLTSEEFKRLRKVCYYLQAGTLRVIE